MSARVQQRFPGWAKHPSSGGEYAEGSIVIGEWSLGFEGPDASVEIPWDQVEIALGEKDDESVYFDSPDAPGWEIAAGDREILQHRIFERHCLRRQLEAFRKADETRRSIRNTIVFLLRFAVVSALVIIVGGLLLRHLVINRIPVSVEVRLGDKVMEEVREEIPIVEDAEVEAMLKDIVDRIETGMGGTPYEFEVYLALNGTPNAFALPGGKMVVFTGLVQTVQSREELAGILAHEMAHVTERHGLRQLVASQGLYYALRIFGSGESGILGIVSAGSHLIVHQSFSREMEREADARAFEFLSNADIDPRGLENFMRRLRGLESNNQLMTLDTKALSSHPPTLERIDDLESRWRQSSRKKGFKPLPENVVRPK